ncbi:MAG TPA: ribosome maturation protein RimP [Sphingomonadaceae bacterium]|nr:ribosome maturation protein RimP [Sphingomonadaceae bacterium]
MADIAALTRLIEPEAQALGFELVRVKMMGGTSEPTLQIMAERPDTRQLTLEDCSTLSRRISNRLDELEAAGTDPITHAYRLEVSSPGIDRPLTRIKDYDDWAGHEARVTLTEPLDGRKQFNGVLGGSGGDTVSVAGHTLPFAAIRNAKLVLTDKLIAATRPLVADGADDEIEFEEEPADDSDITDADATEGQD